VPVEEGGGCCGLEGYQTLCVVCHKRKTAEQARRRAERNSRDFKVYNPPMPLFEGVDFPTTT
jgi:hypothetical protein